MNTERLESVLGYGGGALSIAGFTYALWPRLEPLLPVLGAIAAAALVVAALEGWAGDHARRKAVPASPDELRRRALARYREAHTPLELAAKAVRGLAIQSRLSTPKE